VTPFRFVPQVRGEMVKSREYTIRAQSWSVSIRFARADWNAADAAVFDVVTPSVSIGLTSPIRESEESRFDGDVTHGGDAPLIVQKLIRSPNMEDAWGVAAQGEYLRKEAQDILAGLTTIGPRPNLFENWWDGLQWCRHQRTLTEVRKQSQQLLTGFKPRASWVWHVHDYSFWLKPVIVLVNPSDAHQRSGVGGQIARPMRIAPGQIAMHPTSIAGRVLSPGSIKCIQ
jgi:hypothetical protein